MFRVSAALLAVLLVATFGPSTALHVHRDHQQHRGGHHHGPAAHTHSPRVHHDIAPDADSQFDSDEEHGELIAIALASTEQDCNQFCPAIAATVYVAAPAPLAARFVWCDERAHGPPVLTDAPLRGPPSSALA